ncbi:phage tail protein [Nocardioides panacisoli]|uniref:Tail fiber protein n=1 Tax=Nocardioides panacisoli TaxID=627624 RepID=A0ABP7J0K8_9ACTN
MADPFYGEIRMMSFNFAPKGWAQCNGQTLPINQNQALFSLLGTNFGGNGQTTFALPDYRGRVPVHVGAGHTLGERAGQASHTLTMGETPQHLHAVQASSQATGGSASPSGRYLGGANNAYRSGAGTTTLAASTIGNAGGSQAHENRQPYLVVSFCIALVGIFPSQS